MGSQMERYSTINEYIQSFPLDIREKLESILITIRSSVPIGTIEKISYQMPTFFLEGNLVHFAAYKNHIGLYPTPNGIQAFKNELAKYEGGKGSVQFPHDQRLPLELIKRIVEFRVDENLKKATNKKKKRSSS